jgi:hypothetical protein
MMGRGRSKREFDYYTGERPRDEVIMHTRGETVK